MVGMTEKQDITEELTRQFAAMQLVKTIVEKNRPWWVSGGACLSAGSLLFLALILVGWLAGWWPGGWQLGVVVVCTLILAISGAGQYSRSKKNDR